jgi:Fic family protein
MAVHNQILFRVNWELSKDSLYYMGQIMATIKAIASTPLLPAYYLKLLNVSLQKGAQATTAIEGNTLSIEEIDKIQQGISLPPSKEYQEKEVKNVIDAFNIIKEEIVKSKGYDLISPEIIKKFNFYIGRDLGEHFQGIPGKFRSHNVVVGTYRPPDHKDVPGLVDELCSFLQKEFHFEKGQKFGQAVIQAIVTHVYVEWIHPFGDGNGRTGRLLEFYLLMRAGNPDIASHILSNHYNDTRNEYYRQLDKVNKNGGDLSEFIEYALRGFRDGLLNTMEIIQTNLTHIAWRALVYDLFSEIKYRKNNIFKRKRRILLDFPIDRALTLDEIFFRNPALAREYAALTPRSLKREVDEFLEMKLLIKENGDKYRANIDLLKLQSPQKRIADRIIDGY